MSKHKDAWKYYWGKVGCEDPTTAITTKAHKRRLESAMRKTGVRWIPRRPLVLTQQELL